MFKRVLDNNFEEVIPIWNSIKKYDTNEKPSFNTNLKDYIFEIGGGAVLLLWANTFSPLAWIAKNGYLWVKYKPFFKLSPPLVNNIGVKIIPNWRAVWSDGEGWIIRWSGVEAFCLCRGLHFPFNLWLSIICTWKHISHSIWKRYDQRYINELCVQNINQNS